MTDTIEEIRARHEYIERICPNLSDHAHADRATLLRAVDRLSAEMAKERERRVELLAKVKRLEEALKPFAEFERVIRNSYAEWPDDRDFYRYNDTPILLGDLRRARAALKEPGQ